MFRVLRTFSVGLSDKFTTCLSQYSILPRGFLLLYLARENSATPLANYFRHRRRGMFLFRSPVNYPPLVFKSQFLASGTADLVLVAEFPCPSKVSQNFPSLAGSNLAVRAFCSSPTRLFLFLAA